MIKDTKLNLAELLKNVRLLGLSIWPVPEKCPIAQLLVSAHIPKVSLLFQAYNGILALSIQGLPYHSMCTKIHFVDVITSYPKAGISQDCIYSCNP